MVCDCLHRGACQLHGCLRAHAGLHGDCIHHACWRQAILQCGFLRTCISASLTNVLQLELLASRTCSQKHLRSSFALVEVASGWHAPLLPINSNAITGAYLGLRSSSTSSLEVFTPVVSCKKLPVVRAVGSSLTHRSVSLSLRSTYASTRCRTT